MAATSAMLDAALDYAAHSLPVFPVHWPAAPGRCSCGDPQCTNPAKHPLTAHGLSDATADARQVRAWWAKWPQANIGIAIPKHMVVVDVDGNDGNAALMVEGFDLPPTAIASTAHGHHYVYRTPVEIRPAVGMLTHVDIRGHGSYIVAAPSVHISGVRYEWAVPLEDVTEAPRWLQERGEATGVPPVLRQRLDVAGVLAGVGEGQRDITLFRLASKLRYADVPFDDACQLVKLAAERCTPPFPAAQALTKVLSAYGRYEPAIHDTPDGVHVDLIGPESVRVILQTPCGPVEVVFADMEKTTRELRSDMSITLLVPGAARDVYRQSINLRSASTRESCRRELDALFGKETGWAKLLIRATDRAERAFLDHSPGIRIEDMAEPGPFEWLVDDVIPAFGMTVLFGAGEAAKTYTLMDMALSLAGGLPWLGHRSRQLRTLWVDYETGADMFNRRIRRVVDGNPDYQRAGITYFAARGIPFPDLVEPLRREVLREDIGAIVLDHIAVACGGRPEDAEIAAQYGRAADRIGIPSIHIAHITGEAERDISLTMRPFGSVFWKNIPRGLWFAKKSMDSGKEQPIVQLWNRKQNDGVSIERLAHQIHFADPWGPVSVAPCALINDTSAKRADGDGKFGTVWTLWDAIQDKGPLTVSGLHDVTGMAEGPIRSLLNQHKEMFASSGGGGRGHEAVWDVKV